jgi:hypothetical protein
MVAASSAGKIQMSSTRCRKEARVLRAVVRAPGTGVEASL